MTSRQEPQVEAEPAGEKVWLGGKWDIPEQQEAAEPTVTVVGG